MTGDNTRLPINLAINELNKIPRMSTDKKTSQKSKNRSANQAAVALVSETYPLAFDRKNVRPLKIGIQEDILADAKLPKGKVKRALASYVRSGHYLRSLQPGAERVDLAGQPAGLVTDQEAEHAKSLLKKMRQDREQRQQAEKEQQEQLRINEKLEQLLKKGA